MKSPADLASIWARQWENKELREARLLGRTDWPEAISIPRPAPKEIKSNWNDIAACLRLWREVYVGEIQWESIVYRSTGAAVDIPVSWEIANAEEWIAAAKDRTVRAEYDTLRVMLDKIDPIFHSALVRERALWKNKSTGEVIQAANLAMQLSLGSAQGNPLRTISLAGIDSKFFERNRAMVIRFLDLRFDGEVSRLGLEAFLDACKETDHWLLLSELENPNMLPFPTIRVRATHLAAANLDARALIIVENEKCLHLLPRNLAGVLVILGTGNNLAWLRAPWVQKLAVAYWGDIDTWGLTLLARARIQAPHLVPILMTRETFDLYTHSAVPENVPASIDPPPNLTSVETSLYQYLLSLNHGRLEQEFIPATMVHAAIVSWYEGRDAAN